MARRKGPPKRRTNRPPGAPVDADDAEFDRILDAGVKLAGEAWLDAVHNRGMRYPVAAITGNEPPGSGEVSVRVGTRASLIELLRESHPGAAECLEQGNTLERPMTVVVEWRRVLKIVDLPAPRHPELDG